MHGNELGAIGKSGFNLNVGNQLGNTVHHITPREDAAALAHQLSDGFSVACAFHYGCADERNRFWVIEFQAARAAPFSQQGSRKNQQLVFFTGSQFHESLSNTVIEIATSLLGLLTNQASVDAEHILYLPAGLHFSPWLAFSNINELRGGYNLGLRCVCLFSFIAENVTGAFIEMRCIMSPNSRRICFNCDAVLLEPGDLSQFPLIHAPAVTVPKHPLAARAERHFKSQEL